MDPQLCSGLREGHEATPRVDVGECEGVVAEVCGAEQQGLW